MLCYFSINANYSLDENIKTAVVLKCCEQERSWVVILAGVGRGKWRSRHGERRLRVGKINTLTKKKIFFCA
jgi:hypothetical protein